MPWNRTAYKRKPKFTRGIALTDPQQVINAHKSGRWLYFGRLKPRAYAASWIVNMNFACVMSYIRNKDLFFAHRNDEYPYVWQAQWWEAEGFADRGQWCARCTEVPWTIISELTKDAVAREAEKAVIEHTGQRIVRVQVRFGMPTVNEAPKALLLP